MRKLLSLGLLVGVITLAWPAPASAGNATVTVTDAGFSPTSIDVYPGDTVFWTNTGSRVHTATTKSGPLPFDTGGLVASQTTSINFTTPGAYAYTSATDCLNSGGGQTAGFDCTLAIVHVIDPAISINTAPPPTPTPMPTATPLPDGPLQSITVHISAQGVNPPSATVALGGSVTFLNDDVVPHTATTTGGGSPLPFDTGGLGPGLSASFSFITQGTYTYTSTIDCLNGPPTKGFACGPFKLIVSGQPSALAPPPSNAPVAVAAGASPSVAIDDANGFTPPTLAIHLGQTVTWTNTGKQVHSVVSSPGYASQFDSGGLAPGQKFSFTFPAAGSYDYHSSTEPSYGTDVFGATIVTNWALKGTILVQ
jgi:plastocyanin